MPKFSERVDSKEVDKKFANKTLVYLESETDVRILARRFFFDMAERIEFMGADRHYDSGGCTQVLRAVKDDQNNGLNSYGILDRDSLMRENKWDCLWQTDDEKYKAQQPFGDKCHALCRWEIENYLIDAHEIENLLVDRCREKSEGHRSDEEVAEEILSHLEALIPIMATNTALHEKGIRQLDLGFCVSEKNRGEIETTITKRLKKIERETNQKIRMEPGLAKVENFKSKETDLLSRLDSLLRIIDGKRILFRIKNQYKLKDEIIFSLARRIKENDRIPGELINLIEEIAPENPSI